MYTRSRGIALLAIPRPRCTQDFLTGGSSGESEDNGATARFPFPLPPSTIGEEKAKVNAFFAFSLVPFPEKSKPALLLLLIQGGT